MSTANNAVRDIFAARNASQGRAQTNGRAQNNPDFVPAKIWLNPGWECEVPNADGEMETVFIQLPKGLGLDTMEEAEEKGTPEWVEQMRARNQVLRMLKAEADNLAPGEVQTLTLKLQMRRVADAAAVAPAAESPLLAALMKSFAK